MPELPEVETTKRALANTLVGGCIKKMAIYNNKLRYPIPNHLAQTIENQRVIAIKRRAKYLLIEVASGAILVHLGMSGKLLWQTVVRDKHTHVIWHTDKGNLGYNDPRRFGCVLWQPKGETHPLLAKMGVEPLEDTFNARYLLSVSQRCKKPIKHLIMDGHILVGVGNIYAAEALFAAKIHPHKIASTLSLAECTTLSAAIKQCLREALACGGTTLQDFLAPDNTRGYFSVRLQVYGRANLACKRCNARVEKTTRANRSDYFCAGCQSL